MPEKDVCLSDAPQSLTFAKGAEAGAHPWVTSGLFQKEQDTQVTLQNTSPAHLSPPFLISGYGASSVFTGSHPVLADPSAIPKQGVYKQPGFWHLRQSV